jgi:hypothetical protein
MWLVALPALASGMINVLGPLRLHRFGAGAAAIGVTFLVAAAIEAGISPAVGGVSDRRGRLAPLRFGLAVSTAVLLCFALPTTAGPLGPVIVAIVAALGVFWAPAIRRGRDPRSRSGVRRGADESRLGRGQVVGSVFGGAVAKAAGDWLPMTIAAALCTATLAVISRALAPTPATRPSMSGAGRLR